MQYMFITTLLAKYVQYIHTPRKTPLPLFDLENEFRGGLFVADCREFFQTNNKSNRQMMSVFIYSSSNL